MCRRNMKDTRRQTEQMADETRRMEVRLQELKLAMAAEREQRESVTPVQSTLDALERVLGQ